MKVPLVPTKWNCELKRTVAPFPNLIQPLVGSVVSARTHDPFTWCAAL
jgi:hypothetical protein